MKRVAVVWSSPNSDGLTASAKDRFARGLSDAGAQVQEIQMNRQSIEHCRACGNGRGTLECLTQLERGLTHMGMRAYDRIPVVRYNREYILPALYDAAKVYVDRLENGFDMYY